MIDTTGQWHSLDDRYMADTTVPVARSKRLLWPTVGPPPVVCKYSYTPVRFAAGVSYQQRAFLVGGQAEDGALNNDVWYRDVVVPQVCQKI